MKEKALYIDMDGTLARFHDADKMFIEAMWTPGFYVGLKPFENIVAAIKLFIDRNPEVDVHVLSAVLDTDPPFIVGEKNEWFDKYLPEIDKEQRIFTKAGEDKSEYIDMFSKDCFLLDDYNKNLYEFEAAGGKGIKFHNDINHRGLGEFGGSKGNLWEGALVNYDDSPEKICNDLETFIFGKGKDYKETDLEKEDEHSKDFVIEDDILVEYKGSNEVVVIPEGIREIGINAFWKNEHVKNVVFPESLEVINSGAFAEVDLQELNLPNGLKKIDKNAFVGCNSLISVDLPSSIQSLHNQAFDSCDRLKNINVDVYNNNLFSVAGILYEHDKEIYVRPDIFRCPTGKSGVIVISGEVDKIAPEAFMNCTRISEIKLPETLYAIGDDAFNNCSSLERIEIPPYTCQIYDSAFAACRNLKSVVMPQNLMLMGHGIFDGCKNLSEIVISDENLVDYCERFNFLDEVYMTPCYEALKERYEALTKVKDIDNLIENAHGRCDSPSVEKKIIDKEME